MKTSAQFTQQDGLYIDGQLHTFIEQQLCQQSQLPCETVYQALATLIDEFGCQCRKHKHQADDIVDVHTLLNAYSDKNTHPQCHVDAQTTAAVLDEYCCQVPAIIVIALMDTLTGTCNDEADAQAIYQRAAELTHCKNVYSNINNATAA
ncbi:hypothetical protein [Pseudoalteromonas mariniglutinosa]|uniref:hypothetical protein n=1 Tax=Pseudoalteromonas mariniglutinosa TaxID=206042 RepID=UPI00384CD5AE